MCCIIPGDGWTERREKCWRVANLLYDCNELTGQIMDRSNGQVMWTVKLLEDGTAISPQGVEYPDWGMFVMAMRPELEELVQAERLDEET